MKNLGKIKLTQLNKADLEKREMNVLKGGLCINYNCQCSGSQDTANVRDELAVQSADGYLPQLDAQWGC